MLIPVADAAQAVYKLLVLSGFSFKQHRVSNLFYTLSNIVHNALSDIVHK